MATELWAGKSIVKWSSEIHAAWNGVKESIFRVGDILVGARKQLDRAGFDELLTRLPFEKRTAQRLIAIASDKRLRRASVMKQLPSCWSTLYEIRGLNDAQLTKGIESKVINPQITRSEVHLLRTKGTRKSTRSQTGQRKRVFSITVDRDFDDDIKLASLVAAGDEVLKFLASQIDIPGLGIDFHGNESQIENASRKAALASVRNQLNVLKDVQRYVKQLAKVKRLQDKKSRRASSTGLSYHSEEVRQVSLDESALDSALNDLGSDMTVSDFTKNPDLLKELLAKAGKEKSPYDKFKY